MFQQNNPFTAVTDYMSRLSVIHLWSAATCSGHRLSRLYYSVCVFIWYMYRLVWRAFIPLRISSYRHVTHVSRGLKMMTCVERTCTMRAAAGRQHMEGRRQERKLILQLIKSVEADTQETPSHSPAAHSVIVRVPAITPAASITLSSPRLSVTHR